MRGRSTRHRRSARPTTRCRDVRVLRRVPLPVRGRAAPAHDRLDRAPAAGRAGDVPLPGRGDLILSVASVTALAVALAIAFRSVLAGAFAWSLTLATPLWLGMSHVDFKDMPVAAGLTLVTAGLILSLRDEPHPQGGARRRTPRRVGGAIVLATRAGSLPLLVALERTAASSLGWGIGRGRGSALCRSSSPAGSAPALRSRLHMGPPTRSRASTCCNGSRTGSLARSYPWTRADPRRGHETSAATTSRGGTCPPGWGAASAPHDRRCRRRIVCCRRRGVDPAASVDRRARRCRSCRSRCRGSSFRCDRPQRRRALRRHPPRALRDPRADRHSSGRARRARSRAAAALAAETSSSRSAPSSSSRRASAPRSAGRRTRTRSSIPSRDPTRTVAPGSSTTGA